MTSSREPRILDYGPQKLIGVARVVKTSEDCKNLWMEAHPSMQRVEETHGLAGKVSYYALCRCAAGAEPGAFEYVAAMPAVDGAPVQEGMAEFAVPAGKYVAFPVAGLGDIGRVWGYTGEWLAAHPEWKGFCDGNPEGCGCIEHPSFELYEPGFDESQGLFIYIPVRPAQGTYTR